MIGPYTHSTTSPENIWYEILPDNPLAHFGFDKAIKAEFLSRDLSVDAEAHVRRLRFDHFDDPREGGENEFWLLAQVLEESNVECNF